MMTITFKSFRRLSRAIALEPGLHSLSISATAIPCVLSATFSLGLFVMIREKGSRTALKEDPGNADNKPSQWEQAMAKGRERVYTHGHIYINMRAVISISSLFSKNTCIYIY